MHAFDMSRGELLDEHGLVVERLPHVEPSSEKVIADAKFVTIPGEDGTDIRVFVGDSKIDTETEPATESAATDQVEVVTQEGCQERRGR